MKVKSKSAFQHKPCFCVTFVYKKDVYWSSACSSQYFSPLQDTDRYLWSQYLFNCWSRLQLGSPTSFSLAESDPVVYRSSQSSTSESLFASKYQNALLTSWHQLQNKMYRGLVRWCNVPSGGHAKSTAVGENSSKQRISLKCIQNLAISSLLHR